MPTPKIPPRPRTLVGHKRRAHVRRAACRRRACAPGAVARASPRLTPRWPAPPLLTRSGRGRRVHGVNELEWVAGELWGNVFPMYQGKASECIVRPVR